MNDVNQGRSIPAIMDLLGSEATVQDAIAIRKFLAIAYPNTPMADIPKAAWHYIRTGEGTAPHLVAQLPATGTSLMDIYMDMSDSQRAQLVTAAQVIAKAPADVIRESEWGGCSAE